MATDSQLGPALDVTVPPAVAAVLSPWSLSQMAAQARHAIGLGQQGAFQSDAWRQALHIAPTQLAALQCDPALLTARVADSCESLLQHLAAVTFALLAQGQAGKEASVFRLDMMNNREHTGSCSPSAASPFNAAQVAEAAAEHLLLMLPQSAWNTDGTLACSSKHVGTVLAALVAAVHMDAQAEQAAAALQEDGTAATVAVQLDEQGEAAAMAVQAHCPVQVGSVQSQEGVLRLPPGELSRRLLWGVLLLLPTLCRASPVVLCEPRSVHTGMPRGQRPPLQGGESPRPPPVAQACLLRASGMSLDEVRAAAVDTLGGGDPADIEAAASSIVGCVGGLPADVGRVLQRAASIAAERTPPQPGQGGGSSEVQSTNSDRETVPHSGPEGVISALGRQDGVEGGERGVTCHPLQCVPAACDQLALQAEQELHAFLQGLVDLDVFAAAPVGTTAPGGEEEASLLGLPSPWVAVQEHGTGPTDRDAGLDLALVAWDTLSSIAGIRHDVLSGMGQQTRGPLHPLTLILRSRKVAPDGSEAFVSRRVHTLLQSRVLKWVQDPGTRGQGPSEHLGGAGGGASATPQPATAESEPSPKVDGDAPNAPPEATPASTSAPNHVPSAVPTARDMCWFADEAAGDRSALVGARPLLLAGYLRLQHSAPALVSALHSGALRRHMAQDIAQATGDIAEAERMLAQVHQAIAMLQEAAAAGSVQPQEATVGELELQLLATRRRIVLQEARVRKDTAQRVLQTVAKSA